jgi:AAA domain
MSAEHSIPPGYVDFDELLACEAREAAQTPKPAPAAPIKATPFVWRDPAAIPLRPWIYADRYCRKFVSGLFSPGGIGKSSVTIAEALAIVTGRDLLGEPVKERCNAWLINLEDPKDELDRRILAAMIGHDVRSEEIAGRLFVDSGRDQAIKTAALEKDGLKINRPVIDALEATIRANQIGVVIVDPFVSSHSVPENDNGAIDAVAKEWARLADRSNCAILLVHHTRKRATGTSDVTIEDSRGAVALTDAMRIGRVLNRMTAKEGIDFGIANYRNFIRLDEDGKNNMAPPADRAKWFELHGVPLGNGEFVGVAKTWTPPDMTASLTFNDLLKVRHIIGDGTEKAWRENIQSEDWAGYAIGQALAIDTSKLAGKAKAKAALRMWLASGALVKADIPDKHGKARPCIVCGVLPS